jgi:hypothetical protein
MSKSNRSRGGSGAQAPATRPLNGRPAAPVPNLPSTTGRPSGGGRGNAPVR